MVTNLKEGNTKKCEQYWPESASVSSFGPFKVSVLEEHLFADYIIRHIRLAVSFIQILDLMTHNKFTTISCFLYLSFSTLVKVVALVN